MTFLSILLIALVAIVVFCLLGIGYLVLKAWLAVKYSPREVMLHCTKHGPLRKKQTITFIDQPYCYMCWIEKNTGQDYKFLVNNGRRRA